MRTMIGLLWVAAFAIHFTGVAMAAQVPAELTEEQLKEKALKINKETKTVEEADARLKELIKDKAGTAKLVKMAMKLQKASKESEKPFRFYASLVLAKAAQNVKDYDAADLFYNFCTETALDDLQSSELIIRAVENHVEYLTVRKKHEEVIALCQKVLNYKGEDSLEQFKYAYLFEQSLIATARKGDVKEALEKADELVKKFKDEAYFIQVKARLLREAEKYDEAIKTYEKSIEAYENNEDIKKERKALVIRSIRYMISGIHIEAKQIDKGTDILRTLVKENPDVATFKNDLGFVMADNDQNLDESEKLIRAAIAQDLKDREKLADEGKLDKELAKKSNSAYIDSLGWVLYKKKDYVEALKLLKESIGTDDEESNHIEIWDHVGDCLLAMGKKKEALETFQKALKMEDETKKDGERRKKVTEKSKKLKAETSEK